MKKRIDFLLQLMIILAIALVTNSCSREDDDLDGDGNIKPDVEVPDPEGTIRLSMMSGDGSNATKIDNLFYIGGDYNFSGGSDCYFASLGEVKGLGNISYVPTTGWANKVALRAGCGYVACQYSYWHKEPTFYRIYVSDYVVNETGGIIGADVKYQKPFEGKDEAISLEAKSLTFPSDGGTQTLVFKNSGVVLFNVETDVPEWCSIEKISTFDQPFLTNGIEIKVGENNSSDAKKGKIILTTLHGEKTEIDVTVSSQEPYISLEMDEKEVSAAEQTEIFNIQSNVPFENLTVGSQADWCKAELLDNSAKLNAKNADIKYVGQKLVTETRADDNNSAMSYLLKLSFDENSSTQSRETIVTVSSKDKKTSSSIKIIQKGITFEVKNDKIGFDKNSGYRTITINTTAVDWEAHSSESWCTFSKNGNQITIRVTASTVDRTATVTFKGFDTQITVHQSKYAVGDDFNENGVEGTVGYIGDDCRYIYKHVGDALWSTESVLTGANSETDGQYNMNIIKKIAFWQDYYPAFLLCEQLNINGVTGWYLPSIEELKNLKLNLSIWSSTESDAYNSYCYYSYNNSSRIRQKGYEFPVYAIYKF